MENSEPQASDDPRIPVLNELFGELDEYGDRIERAIRAPEGDKFTRAMIEKIKDAHVARANGSDDELVRTLRGHLSSYVNREPDRREHFAALVMSSRPWREAKKLANGGGNGGNGKPLHKPISEILDRGKKSKQ